MANSTGDRILVVGVGNTLRSDDGVGPHVASLIEKRNLPQVDTITLQQLQMELVVELLDYSHTVIIDAAITGEEVAFYPLAAGPGLQVSSSHHVDAGLFTSLARELYDKRLSIMICSIRGENFDVGEKLSSPVLERADRAAREIIDWIESVFTKSV